jgi:glycosyltransferase involved in cell wall biosynthesis
MSSVMFLATEWSEGEGGPNAFNRDLVTNCGILCKERYRISCCVSHASEIEIASAKANGVKLLSLLDEIGVRSYDEATLDQVTSFLGKEENKCHFIVGHDIFTGPIAIAVAEALNVRSVVFIHTHYASYKSLQDDGEVARSLTKESIQAGIVRMADRVFGVGPLLTNVARAMIDPAKTKQLKRICSFVPGMADIRPMAAGDGFSAISFGRFNDDKNEIIKQPHLSVAAYADFVRNQEHKVYNKSLTLVGLSKDEEKFKEQTQRFRVLSDKICGGAVNPRYSPFLPREEAWDLLRKSHVAMMLSWTEGFGLAGWEAIAAGVPLLLSENSGLFQHLDEEHFHYAANYWVTTVRGRFNGLNEDDIAQASRMLGRMYADKRLRNRARFLRMVLLKRYNWRRRSKRFLRQLSPKLFQFGPSERQRKRKRANQMQSIA